MLTCYHQEQDSIIKIHSSSTKCKPNGSCQRLWNQQCSSFKIVSMNLLYYIEKVEMVIQLQNLENCAIKKDPQLQLGKCWVLKKFLVDITHLHGVSRPVIIIVREVLY